MATRNNNSDSLLFVSRSAFRPTPFHAPHSPSKGQEKTKLDMDHHHHHRSTLGVGPDAGAAAIRKAFLAKARAAHPDGGGDVATFRVLHEAFEALGGGRAGGAKIAPVDVYAEANSTLVPPYRFELATSGRSACKICSLGIATGELRCGSLDAVAGAYGRWAHVACFKTPGVVQRVVGDAVHADVAAALRSADGIATSGIGALSEEHLAALAQRVSDKMSWTKAQKPKPEPAQPATAPKPIGDATTTVTVASTTKLATATKFAFPATATTDALRGKVVVLTGTFGALEGISVGLALGKDALKSEIEKRGAKVTAGVSGKTTLLVVGDEPGLRKVEQASKLPNCLVVDLDGLAKMMRGEADVPLPTIAKFSSGFRGNGLVHRDADAAEALKAAVGSKRARLALMHEPRAGP